MKAPITALFVILFFILSTSWAKEERNLLQQTATIEQVREALTPPKDWIPYPVYTDRNGWDQLFGDRKEKLIKEGEKHLKFDWKVVKATDYLEFERSGDRSIMANAFDANTKALKTMVIAELAEGQGRFIDQIANGIYHLCEITSWASSAHLINQTNSRPLPDYKETLIDLGSGETSAMLSWTHYFLHERLDQVHPLIAERLRYEIRDRVLTPYMENHYWWMALKKKGVMVNNWNPWCNYNVLQCFLLIEDDPVKLSKAVSKTMLSVDQFINYNHVDGACEEGPSYWSHAAGMMYEYLDLLNQCTKGKINLFHAPIVKNMGEYIARSYVGDGWVVNFADASPKGNGDPHLIYRYGTAINSPLMREFASIITTPRSRIPKGGFRSTLEGYRIINDLKDRSSKHISPQRSTWYPETQFCYMFEKKNGFFLGAKGGHNGESHNHNDIGTFSLYADNVPFFIDAGVGTYTRQTFSLERYSIWTMQSDYHNVPKINGYSQQAGRKYKAINTTFDEKSMTFSTDIAHAYPQEANISSWVRSYQLKPDKLIIKDDFSLSATNANNELSFMTWAKPNVSTKGVVLLKKGGKNITLTYDATTLSPSVEAVEQNDPKLSKIWGDTIYKLKLTATTLEQKGSYTITISIK